MSNNEPDYKDNLTEQWKKGELPSGWYYTKLWKGCNVIDYFIGNQFLRYDDSDIVEVIAPVPSYDEWKRKCDEATNYERLSIMRAKIIERMEESDTDRENFLKEEISAYKRIVAELKERNESLNNRDINLCRIANGIRDENFALKELLKECLAHLTLGKYGTSVTPINILCDEVEEALK